MTTRRICVLVFVAVLSGGLAAAQDVRCPERISTAQTLSQPVADWTNQMDATPNMLAGVTFYDGPPKDMASLVPDETHIKGKLLASWDLTPNPGRQYWLACVYSGTRVTLARSLPKELRTCTVTYDPKVTIDGLPSIERLACK
jgi:hypothetical protein